jgi:hypothetical protein
MSDKVEFSLDARGIRAAFDKLNGQTQGALERGAQGGGLVIQAGMKRRIMQGGKSGHVYKRGGKEHVASAPGEPPATDTGALANSIQTIVTARRPDYAETQTGSPLDYSESLEFGTSKMEARPYGRPTLDEDRDAIEAAIIGAIRKAAT